MIFQSPGIFFSKCFQTLWMETYETKLESVNFCVNAILRAHEYTEYGLLDITWYALCATEYALEALLALSPPNDAISLAIDRTKWLNDNIDIFAQRPGYQPHSVIADIDSLIFGLASHIESDRVHRATASANRSELKTIPLCIAAIAFNIATMALAGIRDFPLRGHLHVASSTLERVPGFPMSNSKYSEALQHWISLVQQYDPYVDDGSGDDRYVDTDGELQDDDDERHQ